MLRALYAFDPPVNVFPPRKATNIRYPPDAATEHRLRPPAIAVASPTYGMGQLRTHTPWRMGGSGLKMQEADPQAIPTQNGNMGVHSASVFMQSAPDAVLSTQPPAHP